MTEPIPNTALRRWLLLAAVVCAALLWFALRPKPKPAPARTEQIEEQAPVRAPVLAETPAPSATPLRAPVAKPAQPVLPPAATAAPLPPQPQQGGELQAAFEREVPDATAAQAEARIRDIFEEQAEFDIVFRHAACTRSVCKIDLRWSPELSDPYNGGLIKVVEEFSRELALVPEGQVTPETPMPIPMIAYVARKGYSIERLLAERGAAPR